MRYLVLAGAEAERKPRPWLGLKAVDNRFENLPSRVYDEPVFKFRAFAPVFLIADPAGIKQVMLDKVANYPKCRWTSAPSPPCSARDCSSEGETWRVHRRTMAPSFDPRSVASYARPWLSLDRFRRRWERLADGAAGRRLRRHDAPRPWRSSPAPCSRATRRDDRGHRRGAGADPNRRSTSTSRHPAHHRPVRMAADEADRAAVRADGRGDARLIEVAAAG